MNKQLLDVHGEPIRSVTTKQFDPRLVAALAILEPLLNESGLSLFCLKCHALGLPDGVRGRSGVGEYVLDCGCSHRVLTTQGLGTIQ